MPDLRRAEDLGRPGGSRVSCVRYGRRARRRSALLSTVAVAGLLVAAVLAGFGIVIALVTWGGAP